MYFLCIYRIWNIHKQQTKKKCFCLYDRKNVEYGKFHMTQKIELYLIGQRNNRNFKHGKSEYSPAFFCSIEQEILEDRKTTRKDNVFFEKKGKQKWVEIYLQQIKWFKVLVNKFSGLCLNVILAYQEEGTYFLTG